LPQDLQYILCFVVKCHQILFCSWSMNQKAYCNLVSSFQAYLSNRLRLWVSDRGLTFTLSITNSNRKFPAQFQLCTCRISTSSRRKSENVQLFQFPSFLSHGLSSPGRFSSFKFQTTVHIFYPFVEVFLGFCDPK